MCAESTTGRSSGRRFQCHQHVAKRVASTIEPVLPANGFDFVADRVLVAGDRGVAHQAPGKFQTGVRFSSEK